MSPDLGIKPAAASFTAPLTSSTPRKRVATDGPRGGLSPTLRTDSTHRNQIGAERTNRGRSQQV